MKQYDYLIVGAGLFGAVFARQAMEAGKTCLVVEKSPHIAGNIYTEEVEGIPVHRYGAHIFHTSNKAVWEYVSRYVTFNHYVNTPIAHYKGELYNLPFNMHTFYQMWGVTTPDAARAKIAEQRREVTGEPQNLEEQAISLVGRDIYEKLVKGYTEKQWGRDCNELPAWIIRRLPLRFERNNNYFNDTYQGIPVGGYNPLIEGLLQGVEVQLDTDYFDHREEFDAMAEKVLYTGELDRFYDYRFGKLEYRSLRFEEEQLQQKDFQGAAVVNYTDRETPFTRIIEHKHFEDRGAEHTIITREYPMEWCNGAEPYYPINNERNTSLYAKYRALADAETKYLFGGRLADYRYYDMHQVVELALKSF